MHALNAGSQATSVRGLGRALPIRGNARVSKSTRCEATDSEASTSVPKPWAAEWVPEATYPVVDFLTSTDFDYKTTSLYKNYSEYLESATFLDSVGFKSLPETINGRTAMVGFVAAFGAEIFGAGSFYSQLAAGSLPVFVFMSLITAASIIPVVKGTEGDYLDSLDDTFPKDLLIPEIEMFHGRLAMIGITGLILIEGVKGSALF